MIMVAQIPVARLLGQINLVRWHLQFLGTRLWNLLYNSLMAHRYMKWLLALDINLSNRSEIQLFRPPLVSALKSSAYLLRRRPTLPLPFCGYFFVGSIWSTFRCTCWSQLFLNIYKYLKRNLMRAFLKFPLLLCKAHATHVSMRSLNLLTLKLRGERSGWSTPHPIRFTPKKEPRDPLYGGCGGSGPVWTGV